MGKKIKIKVDNVHVFNSLMDACKFLKKNNVAGLANAVKCGNKTYDGHSIEQLPCDTKKKRKIDKKHSCPVICENLNVTFKTITEAANYAQVDGWTMSKKMQSSGKFIDKNGNVYVRLKPMRSKNVYADIGATIQKNVPFTHRRKKNDDKQEKMIFEQPAQVIVPKVEQPIAANKVDAARAVLKQKAMNYIQNDKYSIAKDFLDVIAALGE